MHRATELLRTRVLERRDDDLDDAMIATWSRCKRVYFLLQNSSDLRYLVDSERVDSVRRKLITLRRRADTRDCADFRVNFSRYSMLVDSPKSR